MCLLGTVHPCMIVLSNLKTHRFQNTWEFQNQTNEKPRRIHINNHIIVLCIRLVKKKKKKTRSNYLQNTYYTLRHDHKKRMRLRIGLYRKKKNIVFTKCIILQIMDTLYIRIVVQWRIINFFWDGPEFITLKFLIIW